MSKALQNRVERLEAHDPNGETLEADGLVLIEKSTRQPHRVVYRGGVGRYPPGRVPPGDCWFFPWKPSDGPIEDVAALPAANFLDIGGDKQFWTDSEYEGLVETARQIRMIEERRERQSLGIVDPDGPTAEDIDG